MCKSVLKVGFLHGIWDARRIAVAGVLAVVEPTWPVGVLSTQAEEAMTAEALFHFDEALRIRPASMFAGFIATMCDTDQSVSSLTDELEREIGQSEAAFNRNLAELSKILSDARTLMDEGGTIDLDEPIRRTEQAEAILGEEFEESLKAFKRVWKLLGRAHPPAYRAVKPFIGRVEEISDGFLRSLADIRWQMMALRAEANRTETGPVFKDAKSLKAHLAKIA